MDEPREVESSELTRQETLALSETERVGLRTALTAAEVETPGVDLPSQEIPVRPNTSEGPIRSDMMCPLLTAEDEKRHETVVERHYDPDGAPAGRTIHRTPTQVLQRPTACPTCGIWVEWTQLVFDKDRMDTRDCAIAIRARGLERDGKLGPAAAMDVDSMRDRLRAKAPELPQPHAAKEQTSDGVRPRP